MKTCAALLNLKTLRAFLICAGLLAMWHYRVPLSEMMAALSDWKAIASYIEGYGALGPVVLFLLMLAQVFIAFIPGHALIIASGYIYGAPVTIFVVATSTIAGSELAFWLARKYGRPLIYRLAAPAMIERWDRLAGNRGAAFYFFTFVLPFLPSDLMCYIAGLGKIPHRQFFRANVAGRMLFTIAMTTIGAFKFRPPLVFWLVLFTVLAALYIAWGIQNNSFRSLRAKMEATSGNLVRHAAHLPAFTVRLTHHLDRQQLCRHARVWFPDPACGRQDK
jgi:uncharacterized membrane protein YdjX (TVP38/TMEM64 family)